jgi:transcription elongation factor B subunit 1
MTSQDDWIRISSRDGFSFVVKRNVALHSGTLRSMLDERRTSLSILSLLGHPPTLTPHDRGFRRGCTKSVPHRREVAIACLVTQFLKKFISCLRAAVTEKFVEYLAFKATYENIPPNEELPEFSERIAPEIALELCV